MPRPTHSPRSLSTIVRAMADDVYEVRAANGQSHFLKLFKCIECDGLSPPDWYRDGTKVCAPCAKAESNRLRAASIEASAKKRLLANLGVAARKRSATMILAAPKWRDREKIKAIYDEARRLTLETGVQYHVDHHYPLQGHFCCGLHVPENLRILTETENCRKSHGHPLEESPALVAFIKQYGKEGLRKWLVWAQDGIK